MDLLFYFAPSKKPGAEGFGIIKLSVIVSGTPESVYSTGIACEKRAWGGNLRRFIDRTDWARQMNANLRQVEAEIEQIRQALELAGYEITSGLITKAYRELIRRQLPVSVDSLAEALGSDALPDLTLLETLEWFMELKFREITYSTSTNYITRRNNVKLWLTETGRLRLRASDFTESLALSFCDWMRSRPNGQGKSISRSHIWRHIIMLKEAIYEGHRRKMIRRDRIHQFIYSVEKVHDLRHMTPKELLILEQIDLTNFIPDPLIRKNVYHARDMFLFCCYTGFHYCDRMSLKSENIRERGGRVWLYKERQKTGIVAKLPLHPEAAAIIEQYGGVEKFPRFSNRDNNALLKRLAKAAALPINLSTKIARKTFAHLCLNVWMIDRDSTATMMGLKSTIHIDAYAQIQEDRIEAVVNW